MSHRFDPTSLREYDIRGIVGRTLGPDDAWALGRSFATLVRRAGGRRVAVGRDGPAGEPAVACSKLLKTLAKAKAWTCSSGTAARCTTGDRNRPIVGELPHVLTN